MGAFLVMNRYLVAMLPVVAFGRITEGSLTAELGIRYTGEDDRVTVIVMNMLVRSAAVHHSVLQRPHPGSLKVVLLMCELITLDRRLWQQSRLRFLSSSILQSR